MRTIIYARHLIDGTGATPLENHTVVLEGKRIEQVVPADAVESRDNDVVIDFGDATLLPGLIDNHVHLVLPGDGTPFPSVQLQSDADLAIRAVHNAQLCARSGVTTVRDCGARGSVTLSLRDGQSTGLLVGAARVVPCGWPITISAGHCKYFGGEADGDDALRSTVRELVGAGADFVKVLASGGGTPGSLPSRPSFSATELRTVVDTAHGLGRKVSAHCTCTRSMENALNAGVDLIEHASFAEPSGEYRFDARVAERIAEAAIPVTSTLQVFRDMVEVLPAGVERGEWERRLDSQRETARNLRDLGVSLLAGSDAGWRGTAFGTFWKTLSELVEIGLSPVQAIYAASGAVAEALGHRQEYGTIQPGLMADLVAVDGNVGADIRLLKSIRAVFQGGMLVHERRRMSSSPAHLSRAARSE